MEREFIKFVSEIMDVPVEEIDMETVYKDFEPWDSLMMMQLVMELEQEYDVSIPLERLNRVHKLGDLYELIRK